MISSTVVAPCEKSAIDAKAIAYSKERSSNEDTHIPESTSISTRAPCLTLTTIPKQLITMEYSVRGGIVSFAKQIQEDMEKNPNKYPFKKVIPTNLGNPQILGQPPLTYIRQVCACLLYPPLINYTSTGCPTDNNNPTLHFPPDVVERVKEYLNAFPAHGAYSESQGIIHYRRIIADWFTRRDGYVCSPDQIYLTDGATKGICCILDLLISGPEDGILIPKPNYPLYNAQITKARGTSVPYYLHEERQWDLPLAELNRAYIEGQSQGLKIRALVFINPSNPTGSVLKKSSIQEAIRFCEQNNLVLIADEVYQTFIFSENEEFYSCRQAVLDLKSCGGFMQLENFSDDIKGIIVKCLSVSLCSNSLGQAVCALMCQTPPPFTNSYAVWQKEKSDLFNEFKARAHLVDEYLNGIEGLSCQPISGGIYAFPKIDVPPKAILHAQQLGIEPDMLYCQEMVENIGLVSVPGSGFGQAKHTYHFRISLLIPSEQFKHLLEQVRTNHCRFMQAYK